MIMFKSARRTDDRYLLVLGADILLRERAIVSAIRSFQGPVLGMAPDISGLNRFFDGVIQADYYDAPAALAAVDALAQNGGPSPIAVAPIIEMTVHVAAAIANRYKLPGLSDEAVRRSRDKHLMKQAFDAHGVPCARHLVFGTLAELREATTTLEYPVILKPRDFAGNTGTVKVESSDELASAYDHCRRELLDVAPLYGFEDGRFQVEEFVTSTREISVEVLNEGSRRWVLAVTDKAKLSAPHFTEVGHLVPSQDSDDDEVKRLGFRACEALGIDRGIAHVEILMSPAGPKVVEVAARPGGDGIMDLIERVLAYNPYDFHYASYMNALPDDFQPPADARGVGAIRFLKAPVGMITEVRLPGTTIEAEAARYVTSQPGEMSYPPSHYQTRNGVIELYAREGSPADFAVEADRIAERRVEEIFSVDGSQVPA